MVFENHPESSILQQRPGGQNHSSGKDPWFGQVRRLSQWELLSDWSPWEEFFFFSGPVLSGWMVWYIIMFKVVDAFWIFLIGDNLFLQSFFGLKISQNILTKIWSRTSSNTATSSPETRHVQDARWLNPWGTFRNHLLDFPIFSFCQKTHLRPVQMWWMPRVERGVPLCPWPMQVGVSFGGVFDHQPVFGRLRGARLGKSILAGLSWTQVVWFEAGFHQSFSSQGHKI